MPNECADAFLDCIMKRSRYDTMMHMGMIILVMVVTPIIILGFIHTQDYLDTREISGIIGAQLLENLIFNFIIFSIVLALYKHHCRDILWMNALAGYAESYGHDVSELRGIIREFDDRGIRLVVKVFRIYIIALTVLTVIQGVAVSVKGLDIDTCVHIVEMLALLMLILLCISTGYQFKKLRKYDSLQRRFERLFCSMMSKELHGITPNAGRIWAKWVWPHVILMIVTVGLYSLPFSLYVVHTMNVHITTQHRFEGRLMVAIMEKEGATGIRRIEKDQGNRIGSAIRNFFWSS